MSMHKTHAHMADLNEALKQHHLPHDKPSQLADCFRSGWLAHAAKDSDFAVVGYAKRAQFTIDAMRQIDPARRPAAQEGEVDIKSRVSELIAEHGTLRAAARSLNIDVGYLSRLEHGDKVHPSSETLAKIGLRDAGVKYQRLVFLPTQPAAQAGEVDDGDVTGQPGPLPETGWDVVPAGAFRKPSPTAGMNLGQRIRHVGGRENAAGYIEFGSVAAVRALVRQYLRDLPTQPAAQATPEPDVAHLVASIKDDAKHAAYMAEIDNTDARDNYLHKLALSLDDLASRVHQQATPEPVGEVVYQIKGEAFECPHAWRDATEEAFYTTPAADRRIVYTRPAPGVPDGFVSAQAEFNQAIDFAIKEGVGAAVFLDAWRHGDTSEWPEFAAAQAKGS